MISRAETTDLDHLMDPASHAPRDCDHCRTECLSPADRLAWEDVQLCAVCAEAAVQRDEGACPHITPQRSTP